jgi:hypothetical protein
MVGRSSEIGFTLDTISAFSISTAPIPFTRISPSSAGTSYSLSVRASLLSTKVSITDPSILSRPQNHSIANTAATAASFSPPTRQLLFRYSPLGHNPPEPGLRALIASRRYSVLRTRMGETDAARLAGRKQARIAAASRTTATERNAAKSSACMPKRRLCIARPTK